jgi:tetratricopeptide (TPR) repeat protein
MDVSHDVPAFISEGLKNGTYQRTGGAIREVKTSDIVAFIREAHDLAAPLVSELLALPAGAAGGEPLNLAITSMGFVVVMQRLDAIKGQLTELQEVLGTIGYKIDLSFYANFRAALDLAANAFTVSDAETRRASALQAINRFLESEHHYLQIVDLEIGNQSQAADDYLYTLCLAYVTEARCYLELGELDTAQRRLQEGLAAVKPRFARHTKTLLTSNPAAYLHPAIKDQVDLRRLTSIYRWLTPGIDENSVFEALRANLFELAKHPDSWVESLPPAIRLPAKDKSFRERVMGELTKQFTPQNLTKRLGDLAGSLTSINKRFQTIQAAIGSLQEPVDDIFARLPDTLRSMEQMIEHCCRFETYLAELQTMQKLGMSFRDWQGLAAAGGKSASSNHLMVLSLRQSVH